MRTHQEQGERSEPTCSSVKRREGGGQARAAGVCTHQEQGACMRSDTPQREKRGQGAPRGATCSSVKRGEGLGGTRAPHRKEIKEGRARREPKRKKMGGRGASARRRRAHALQREVGGGRGGGRRGAGGGCRVCAAQLREHVFRFKNNEIKTSNERAPHLTSASAVALIHTHPCASLRERGWEGSIEPKLLLGDGGWLRLYGVGGGDSCCGGGGNVRGPCFDIFGDCNKKSLSEVIFKLTCRNIVSCSDKLLQQHQFLNVPNSLK